MRLSKKDTTILNDELVFKPIQDLQNPYIDRRNSWTKPSHLPAQPSPNPSTTSSLPANHHRPSPSPITPSKPTTAITTPPTHLPPTPSPTPTRNLKRSYSSLIEVRLPSPTPTKEPNAAASLNQQPRKQETSSPSSSPSTRPSKRQRQRQSHATSTPISSLTRISKPPPALSTIFPPTHNPLTPPFSIRYRRPPTPTHPPISAVELKRAAESVLRQVDWEIVAEDVASNRKSGVFRKVVRGVLQGGVDALGGL